MARKGEAPDLTRLVLAVGDDGWSDGLFVVVLEVVRRGVRTMHLRRPVYVGIEAERWDDAALCALADEFYADRVFPGLDLMRAEARRGGIGVAYVRRMFRCWIVDRQRERDPIGTANFKALRCGIELAIESGELVVVGSAGRRIDKRTRLRFAGASADEEPWRDRALGGVALQHPGWPRLRDQLRSRGEDATIELAGLLDLLRERGCPGFVFEDLITALHQAACVGPTAELDYENAESPAPVIGEREAFEHLEARIRRAIDAEPIADGRRGLLHALVGAFVDAIRDGGFERVNLSEFGDQHGLCRRRASELKQQLERIAARVSDAGKPGIQGGQI